jgi:hypothetical protein
LKYLLERRRDERLQAVQARFTEYLDGRLNGREMQLFPPIWRMPGVLAGVGGAAADAGVAGRAGPGAGAGRPAAARFAWR